VPATVSSTGRRQATGPWERRGIGSAVSPTDPAAFLGRFAPARATGSFPGRSWGSASGPTRVSSDDAFAELGPERNGVFLP